MRTDADATIGRGVRKETIPLPEHHVYLYHQQPSDIELTATSIVLQVVVDVVPSTSTL